MRAMTLAFGLILYLGNLLGAQCPGLTTTFASNNGQSGNMFDIVNVSATLPVSIDMLDVNVDAGTWNFEVYTITAGTSFVGSETNAAAWTLIATIPGVVSAGMNLPTPLPANLGVLILPGATQGFYVTVSTGTGMNYTNGTAAGAVYATDGVISILQGTGNAYPFAGTFSPRVFNGNVYYSTGTGAEYQSNTPEASFDVDGVMATGCGPAITTGCAGSSFSVNVASTLPNTLWEVALSLSPVVSLSGPGITVGGQILNLNRTLPLFFLNGGALPAVSPFPGNLTLPVVPTVPLTLSAQAIFTDVAAPAGIRLSQAAQLDTTVPSGVLAIAGPAGDDVSVSVDVVNAPNCWCAGVPFYGTSYTTLHVASNGRVLFGGQDNDLSPTVLEAIAGRPFVGFWTDLNPTTGGSITLSTPAAGSGIVRVDYTNVNYFGQTTPVSFGIEFNCVSGDVILDGLTGIVPHPVSGTQFLGMSPGMGSATDPGVQAFGLGAAGAAGSATEMFYDFATGVPLVPSLVPGTLSSLQFFPDGGGNYIWFGS